MAWGRAARPTGSSSTRTAGRSGCAASTPRRRSRRCWPGRARSPTADRWRRRRRWPATPSRGRAAVRALFRRWPMHRRRALVALGVALGLAGCAAVRARFPGPDVLFGATPEAVSLEMLKIAAVTPEDVVFDLGSGDGRVVIAAARDFGAHSVGVEIDPKLVNISKDAALAAGVAARTMFLWQDLFVADLTGATVVTLYLRDDVNLRLRPKLLKELVPGTRVVSHDFDMGDWEPDRVQPVRTR